MSIELTPKIGSQVGVSSWGCASPSSAHNGCGTIRTMTDMEGKHGSGYLGDGDVKSEEAKEECCRLVTGIDSRRLSWVVRVARFDDTE
jgi:uncharacterized protein YceK